MQAELRDIHLPDPVSWWPPAPGWYGVLLLLVILIIASWFLFKKLRQPSLRKLAMLELNKIELAFNQHQNPQLLCSDISILLRRVAMSYDSRNKQAGVTGKEWLTHLNDLCGQVLFDTQLENFLLYAPYQLHPAVPTEKLISTSKQWLALLPRSKSS